MMTGAKQNKVLQSMQNVTRRSCAHPSGDSATSKHMPSLPNRSSSSSRLQESVGSYQRISMERKGP